MSLLRKFFKIKVIFLFLTLSLVHAEPAPFPAQLLINIYQTPSPMQADNKSFLIYEIYLTNFMKASSKITSFFIEDPSKNNLITLDNIKNAIQSRNPSSKQPSLNFEPGETKTVLVWIPFEKETRIPNYLVHRISIDSSFQDKNFSFDLGSYAIATSLAPPLLVDAPLRGTNWLAGNAPSNTSDHRTASMIINGKPYYAQRYAIDFVQIGQEGKSYRGDVHKNSNYHCYNQDVLAVADGTVVQLQDGIPENIPNSGQFAVPITEKTLPGNFLVIKIAEGKYAGYAHIIPGSFKVKIGDRVARNQVLAKLGNSGNSTEPHLHFQITNGKSFLASNGIPYGFKQFSAHPSQLLYEPKGSIAIQQSNEQFIKYTNQLVLENSLVNFE
jgi:hypothetical protein